MKLNEVVWLLLLLTFLSIFGVVVEYFRRELKALLKPLDNRPHDELDRYLIALTKKDIQKNPTEGTYKE